MGQETCLVVAVDAELSDATLRVTCAASLVKVADLFQHVSRDSYEASLALRRARTISHFHKSGK